MSKKNCETCGHEPKVHRLGEPFWRRRCNVPDCECVTFERSDIRKPTSNYGPKPK